MNDLAKHTDRASEVASTDLEANGVRQITETLAAMLADTFSLYIKTKNFHWHMAGTDFRDYHRALDEQAEQLLAATDPLAERARKLGCSTIKSIGHIARLSKILDNDAAFVTAQDMLAELRDDNLQLARSMRDAHEICDSLRDFGSTSVIDTLIDEAETRHWFLFEMTRPQLTEND